MKLPGGDDIALVHTPAIHMAAVAVSSFVALQHVGFLVLESFLWQTDFGRKVFAQSRENAAITAVLAQNQGLYNGFLAAGIAFALVRGDVVTLRFFLGCVVVAGIVGGATASGRILVIQAVPGAIAFGLTFLR